MPAWRFFKVLYTGEYRYLVNSNVIPEYFESLLYPIWDDMLSKWDDANGINMFKNAFLDTKDKIIQRNELLILRACARMMEGGDERALKHIKDYGFSFKEITVANIEKVWSKVRRIETRMRIESVKKNNQDISTDNKYVKGVVSMSVVLGITLNPYSITISEWIAYNGQCKQLEKVK